MIPRTLRRFRPQVPSLTISQSRSFNRFTHDKIDAAKITTNSTKVGLDSAQDAAKNATDSATAFLNKAKEFAEKTTADAQTKLSNIDVGPAKEFANKAKEFAEKTTAD